MNKFVSCLLLLFGCISGTVAQNWDYIRTSGEYYYGMGSGKTEAEADKMALAALVQMIATHVSSDFQMLTDETNTNGNIDHKTYVTDCVSTYSSSTLTNVEKWTEGKEPNVTVRRYMLRSELGKIYEKRIEKIHDMEAIADEALAKGKVDMALQYYYWAYSLVRSLQHPADVKGEDGRSLVTQLPIKLRGIFDDISVSLERRDGDCVDMLFNYKGRPVSGLDYTYSDGRDMCDGTAKDGRGMLEMIPGYDAEYYHLNIEYEYKNLARGDDELLSVLNVVSKTAFPKSEVTVKGSPAAQASSHSQVTSGRTEAASHGMADRSAPTTAGTGNAPRTEQLVPDDTEYSRTMDKVIASVKARNYSQAAPCFTIDGLDVYNRLISYGTGRVVGTPQIKYFRGGNGQVAARGLQMSFSFMSGKRKKTFVEDVIFMFDKDKKICNVTFGLGKVATDDILTKYAPGWKDETRELIMEFLENYKTAYCLKRIDYIRDIFADDAVIIIGNVVKRNLVAAPESRAISLDGQDIIRYNRYDKETYLANLEQNFRRNEFINIKFTNNDVQWLEKYQNEEIYGIQIGQEYTSSRYADKGYLFLLVDMTDHDAPQIKVRTWQPNEVSMSNIYSAGDFYNE